MEQLAFFAVVVFGGGVVATIVATWINIAGCIDTDRRVAALERRAGELEEWRNS